MILSGIGVFLAYFFFVGIIVAYLRPIFRTSELHCRVVKDAEVARGEDWSCGLIRAASTNKVLGDV